MNQNMLEYIFKNKWNLSAKMFFVSLGLIWVDWKYISMYYGSPQQYCVSFLYLSSFVFFHSIKDAEEDLEDEDNDSNNSTAKHDSLATSHVQNSDATKCYKGLDAAYFSFENSTDFDYFLNGLQNKINQYRKMRGVK